MKKLISAIAAILLSLHVFAAPLASATAGKDWILLYDDPCEITTLNIAVPLFKAEAIIGGKHFDACFTISSKMVYILYPDGDQSVVPISAFSNKKIT